MDPVTLRWVQAELTVAMDLYDRCVTGLRLTPVSTKAVDAAAVLFESVRPLPEPAAGWADVRPPYHGLPGQVIIDAAKLATRGRRAAAAVGRGGDHRGRPRQDLPVRAPDERLRPAGHLGPAGPGLPGHRQGRSGTVLPDPRRAAAGRAARLQGAGRLPARQGPRAAGVLLPRTSWSRSIRRWTADCYHRQPHSGLCVPEVPGLEVSPLEMFAHGIARAGYLQVPARADLAFDFLARPSGAPSSTTAWRSAGCATTARR